MNTNNKDLSLAYGLARLGMGVNLACHGLVRIPKVSGFSDWMVGKFEPSLLPSFIVRPFSYSLPFIELSIGLLLILGLFSRQAIVAGSLLIITLIMGSCLVEMWEAAGSQMVYLAYLATLLIFREKFNHYSLDHKRA